MPSELDSLAMSVKKHGGWVLRVKTSKVDSVQLRINLMGFLQRVVKSAESFTEIVVSDNQQSLDLWVKDHEFIQSKLNL